jgi:predicted protein tyrosine phosphatase
VILDKELAEICEQAGLPVPVRHEFRIDVPEGSHVWGDKGPTLIATCFLEDEALPLLKKLRCMIPQSFTVASETLFSDMGKHRGKQAMVCGHVESSLERPGEYMIIQPFAQYRVEAGLGIQVPHIVISITNFKSEPADIPDNENCRGILRLSFPDRDVPPKDGPNDLFSEDDARKVWKFVLDNMDVQMIVVHCTMGASRSPGMAAAISKVFLGDDEEFFKKYAPNRHVFRTMLDVWYDEFEKGDGK